MVGLLTRHLIDKLAWFREHGSINEVTKRANYELC
jgi:hypothetical protein